MQTVLILSRRHGTLASQISRQSGTLAYHFSRQSGTLASQISRQSGTLASPISRQRGTLASPISRQSGTLLIASPISRQSGALVPGILVVFLQQTIGIDNRIALSASSKPKSALRKMYLNIINVCTSILNTTGHQIPEQCHKTHPQKHKIQTRDTPLTPSSVSIFGRTWVSLCGTSQPQPTSRPSRPPQPYRGSTRSLPPTTARETDVQHIEHEIQGGRVILWREDNIMKGR